MLERQNVAIEQQVEARKEKIDGEAAWAILKQAEVIKAGRGKKVVTFDPATDGRDEILRVCTGRTGNLRAPTLRLGGTLLVGYNDGLYEDSFG